MTVPELRLAVVPCVRDEANAFIERFHRHHPAVVGCIFALAVADILGVVGVAVVGRPVARGLQDGWTAEVTRTCVDAAHCEEMTVPWLAGALFRARELGATGSNYAAAGLAALRRSPWMQTATMLLGAAGRASTAIGYRKLVTYTLKDEGGGSLRAAGWKIVAEVRGRSWDAPSRPRVDRAPLQDKFRWEAPAR